MISKTTISGNCYSKTLYKAYDIARHDEYISRRRCSYNNGTTVLSALVDSSSSCGVYEVAVDLDEDHDKILYYNCTCPANYKYSGMCKHAAALTLLFNEKPDTFQGYSTVKPTSTSNSIANLMQRVKAVSQSTNLGTISLELTIEPQYEECWAVSFKIASPEASYAIKNISTFLEDIHSCAWRQYGKNLAFTHSKDMFTEQAWQVVLWIQRTVNNASKYGLRKYWSYHSCDRTLYVNDSQLIELLDLYLDLDVNMIHRDELTYKKLKPIKLDVIEEDPQFCIEIISLKNGGYQLKRNPGIQFIVFGERVYAWDNHCIYRCSSAFSACETFLEDVYLSDDEMLTISEEDAPLFCTTLLPILQDTLNMQVPEEMEELRPVEGKLEFYLDARQGSVECHAKAIYGEKEYNLLDFGNKPGKPPRDTMLESAAMETLLRYLPLIGNDATLLRTENDDDVAQLIFHGLEELQHLGDVFTTEAFDRLRRKQRTYVQTGLSIEGNLINLNISADDMSPDEIALLLQSYRTKKKYHKLKDGSFINLEDATQTQDLDRLENITSELGLSMHDLATGELEIAPYHAFLLDSLATDNEKDESFKQFVSTFADNRAQHHELPNSLKGILRPYQVEGFNWLCTLADTGLAGILADEMGLGKSLQAISLLLDRIDELTEAPALIVCPASLVYNWQAEFVKFAPQMRVALLAGPKNQRDEIREQGEFQVLITSYDTLRIDVEGFEGVRFSYQIIDEAQFIKNHNTKAARAVKAINATHRIALTGTPIENRLSELWSIFDFLMPGMLGSYKKFRERYEAPILAGDTEMSARLGAKLGPFIMRRMKSQVLKDLPDKLETVVHAKLEGEQLKLYTAHESRLRRAITEEDDDSLREGRIAVLAELTKLRQLCCDPRLLFSNTKKHGAKLDTIAQLIQAAHDSRQKVLVFSQFTSFLELIAEELTSRGWSYYVITGATPKQNRVELVERFNHNDVPVFLISLKAGGTGLNLTGASVVIHADPWWNAAAQNQATDRAHRIGQTKDVSVFKVIADDTIEERILRLQEAKSDLADAVLAADSSSLATLSKEELISLLSEE